MAPSPVASDFCELAENFRRLGRGTGRATAEKVILGSLAFAGDGLLRERDGTRLSRFARFPLCELTLSDGMSDNPGWERCL